MFANHLGRARLPVPQPEPWVSEIPLDHRTRLQPLSLVVGLCTYESPLGPEPLRPSLVVPVSCHDVTHSPVFSSPFPAARTFPCFSRRDTLLSFPLLPLPQFPFQMMNLFLDELPEDLARTPSRFVSASGDTLGISGTRLPGPGIYLVLTHAGQKPRPMSPCLSPRVQNQANDTTSSNCTNKNTLL